jgi:archaellum component FlaD/FlaE
VWRKLTVKEIKEQTPEEEQEGFDIRDHLLGLLFIAILGEAGI